MIPFTINKYLLSFLFLLMPFTIVIAQTNDDNDIGNGEITYEEELFGLTYYRYEREIGLNIVTELMKDNRSALDIMETAQLKRDVATISSGAGVAVIIFTVTTSFNEGFNWAVAAAGAGAIGLGFYLYKESNKDAKEAVRIYNNSLDTRSAYNTKNALRLGLTSSGVGLSYSF